MFRLRIVQQGVVRCAFIGVILISLGACNKRSQNVNQGQSQHAASGGERGTGSSAGYIGGGSSGYLADNKSVDEPAGADEGGEVAHADDDEVSPPPGDGCVEGRDCCASHADCVATQFMGCCRTESTPTECTWSARSQAGLAADREQCPLVDCLDTPPGGCAEDNDGKEAQCVLGRCRLVPFR